jgi:tape measure domain-containing protein
MAANDEGRAYYGLGLDNNQLRADASRASNILKGIGNSAVAEGARIDNAYKKIAGAVGGYFTISAAQSFIREIVKVRGEVESLSISFETLLGSKQKADVLFGQIKDFAAKTPLELTPLAKGAQTLLSFNIEAERVMPILKQIGDISMGNQGKFDALTLAFSQMSSVGKLMGNDLLQMINAGFNPLSEIAAKTGKSIGALKEEMSNGAISAEMVADAFASAAGEGGKFYGMLDKQSKGIEGSISNLHGAIDDMMNDLGTKGQGVITGIIAGATSIVENYEKVGKAIADIVIAYGAYKAALITLNAIQNLNRKILMQAVLEKKLATAAGVQLSNAEAIAAARTKLLSLAQHGLVKALQAAKAAMLSNPYTLVAVAVAALVFGIYKLVTAETAAEAAQRKHNEAMEAAREKKENLISKTQQLANKINDETQTIYAQIKAWKELQKEMPEAFAGMTMRDFKNMKPEDREKLINKTADDREIAELEKRLEDAQAKVNEINKVVTSTSNQGAVIQAIHAKGLKEAEETLRSLKKEKAERDEIIRQAEFEAKTDSEKLDILNEQLKKYQDQYSELEKLVPESEMVAGAMNKDVTPALSGVEKGLFDVNTEWNKFYWQTGENIAQLNFLNGKINETKGLIGAIGSGTEKTYIEERKAAEAEWKRTAKIVSDIEAGKAKATKAEYEKAVTNAKAAKTAADSLGINTSASKLQKDANQEKIAAADRIKKIKEYEKAIAQSIRDTELEIEQARIEAMEDGFEKQKAQIDLNYKKLIAQNKQRREEMVKELNAKDEIVWQQENPKFKEKGLVYTNRKTDNDLSDEQLKQLEEFTRLANTYQENAKKVIIRESSEEIQNIREELYSKFKTELQNELADIDKNYDEIVKKAKKNGADLLEINEINSQRKKEKRLAELEDEIRINNEELNLAEKQIEAEAGFFDIQSERELKLYNLKKEFEEKKLNLLLKQQSIGKQGFGNQIIQAKTNIKSFETEAKKIKIEKFELIANSFREITKEIADSNSELSEFAGEAGKIGGILEGVANGFKQGGAAGAFASLAVAAITDIINMNAEAEKRIKEHEDKENRQTIDRTKGLSDLIQMQIDALDSLFGSEKAKRFIDAYERLSDSIRDNANALKKIVPTVTQGQSGRAPNGTRDGSPGYFGGIGNLNNYVLLANKLSEKNGLSLEDIDKLAQERQRALDSVVSVFGEGTQKDLAIEYINQVYDDLIEKNDLLNKKVSESLGTTISELSDGLVELFRNGTDSAKDFAESFEKIMSDVIINIFKKKVIEDEMTGVYNLMRDSFLDDDQITADEIEAIKETYISAGERAKEQWDALQLAFKEAGVDLNSGQDREATSKGFASMSQDTGDELKGMFTASTAHTYSINENTKILVANSNLILQHLSGIKDNTDFCRRLDGMDSDLRAIKNSIDDINLKGITIKK